MKTTTEIRASVAAELRISIPNISRWIGSNPRHLRNSIYAVADVADDGTCTGITLYRLDETKAPNHYHAIDCVVISDEIDGLILDFICNGNGARAAREAAIDTITDHIVKYVNSRDND